MLGLVLPAAVLSDDRLLLTEKCEIAVARSAAPLRLRSNASVYVLDGKQYRKVISGDGPLTCVVERNHPDSLIPQCMDQAGVDSVLPAILSRSEMAIAGASFDAIDAKNAELLQAGHFQPADRPGVSYMMSNYNYIYVASAGQVLKVNPHVMFYAPNVTNADVGGSFQGMTENIGTPFVFNEGLHGYMVVYTQYAANPNEVAEECRGQLREPPPSFDPFSKG
jgi:hypothetical protein